MRPDATSLIQIDVIVVALDAIDGPFIYLVYLRQCLSSRYAVPQLWKYLRFGLSSLSVSAFLPPL